MSNLRKFDPDVQIEAVWFYWNYGRDKGEPHWIETTREILVGRSTRRTHIVHYANGNNGITRKILKKFRRFDRAGASPLSDWIEYYGSHERLSYSKIIYRIVKDSTSLKTKLTTPSAVAA